MTQRLRTLGMVPLLALLVLFGCGKSEPEYQGRTISGWVSGLEDPDPGVKAMATGVLLELLPREKAVIPAVIGGMKQGNYGAAELLGQIGKDAGDATPSVVLALGETMRNKGNLSVRLAASRSLPKFGSASGPAIPAVIEMFKDDSAVIREMAAETLGKLPPSLAQQATPALLHAAKTDVLSVQQKALETLRIVDPEALKKAGGA